MIIDATGRMIVRPTHLEAAVQRESSGSFNGVSFAAAPPIVLLSVGQPLHILAGVTACPINCEYYFASTSVRCSCLFIMRQPVEAAACWLLPGSIKLQTSCVTPQCSNFQLMFLLQGALHTLHKRVLCCAVLCCAVLSVLPDSAGIGMKHHLLSSYFHAVLSVALAQFGTNGFPCGVAGIIRLAEESSYVQASDLCYHLASGTLCCKSTGKESLCCYGRCFICYMFTGRVTATDTPIPRYQSHSQSG